MQMVSMKEMHSLNMSAPQMDDGYTKENMS